MKVKVKNHCKTWTAILLVLLSLTFPFIAQAQSSELVVRAVLFYSPTCPHCARVIQEDLPPLLDKYPTQLEIIGVDVSSTGGANLYQSAIEHYQIPQERLGVPTLIVDDTILVGSIEIPEIFPGLVEYYLSQGGVDWPDLPGLAETLATPTSISPETNAPEPTESLPAHLSPTPQDASTLEASPVPTLTPLPIITSQGFIPPDAHDLTWQDKFFNDLVGNTLSVIVLAGMLGALVWAIFYVVYFNRKSDMLNSLNASWIIPILSLVGFFVAGYLAYIETAQVSAVCGPIGDCNTVQQSEYARLFGVLPIGVLGLSGYILILTTWIGIKFGGDGIKFSSELAFLGMTFLGTIFSIYLTFLEPFVIGATCAWCLTSAIIMTILMLLSLQSGKIAYLRYIKKHN